MINTCLFGDCKTSLDKIIQEGITAQTCITSPPYYGLRSYLDDDNPDKHLEVGLEHSPEEYIQNLVEVFRKVREVLSDDGTLWVNIGDSYYNYRPGNGAYAKQTIAKGRQDLPMVCAKRSIKMDGLKNKDLIGIPWMLAFALRNDGWYLRQDIIWSKPNPMPESVKDRCTKSHEYIFLFSKNQDYYFETLYENSRRKRSVWEVQVKPYKGAHFATYPTELIQPCIVASTRPNDIVLDPFLGSGTTALLSERLNRNWIGCELNEDYRVLQDERLGNTILKKLLDKNSQV